MSLKNYCIILFFKIKENYFRGLSDSQSFLGFQDQDEPTRHPASPFFFAKATKKPATQD